MTPGINAAKKAKIAYTVHEYEHDPSSESYGIEAAEKLGFAEERIFKTLLVQTSDKQLAVGIVPVSLMLDLKKIAKALGVKKVAMADGAVVERTTGYVLGGVSPLGQKRQLKTIIDLSARNYTTMFVSAGRRGLDIELAPGDLQKLTRAKFEEISK